MNQDNSSKNNMSEEWPTDVRQAYESLKIPSLYDAVLANEKLSLEMRRQEREMKNVSDGIQGLAEQLHVILQMLSEEWEEIEEDEERESYPAASFEAGKANVSSFQIQLIEDKSAAREKEVQEILIESYDTMQEQSFFAKQMAHQLMTLMNQKEQVTPSSLSLLAEEMVKGLIDLIESSRYKFLNRFDKAQIDLIDPLPGEVFDQKLHRRLDCLSGGVTGTIAKVIRIGYIKKDETLRRADVIIYQ